MKELIIDSEFRDLLPPLPEDKRKQLEENILRDGIREPLTIWQGILIDGHNRYEIAQKHGLDFTTVEKDFASRNDAMYWMIINQFGRRDLTTYDRSVLALKLKPIIAAEAKEKQAEYHGNQYQSAVPQIFAEVQTTTPHEKKKNENNRETNAQIAEKAGVSRETIRKVEKIEAQATPEIKTALRSGDLSINAAYEGVKAGATTVDEVKEVKESKKPHVSFNSGNNEWYTPADIIEATRKVFGTIDLDPASSKIANETVQATKIYTAEDDGLVKEWEGNVWLNPPYASGLIELFVDKLLTSDFTQAIVLVNNATDTEWFSRLSERACAVVFPKGRVKFHKPDGKTGAPLQGQAILYFGENITLFKEIFSQYGRCWQ